MVILTFILISPGHNYQKLGFFLGDMKLSGYTLGAILKGNHSFQHQA